MYYDFIKFIIILVICSALYIITLNKVIKEVKNFRILKEKYLLFNSFNEDNINIIDSIISDNIVKYRALNIDHDSNFYMGSNEQNKMINSVLKDTLESLSPVFLEKSCLIYNKEKLEDIIYSKILMAVLAITVEINGNYKEK